MDFLAYSVILAGLYLLLRQVLAQPWLRERMTAVAVALTVAMCVAYLVAVLGHWLRWWELVGALRFPPLRPLYEGLSYGNPGAVAVLAVIGLIVGIARIGLATSRSRVAVAGLTGLVGVLVLITGSRASWVAVAIAIAAVDGPRHRATRYAHVRGQAADGSILAPAIVVGAIVLESCRVVGPRVIERFAVGGTEAERQSFFAVARRMFGEAPITGIGPGMWVSDRMA